MRSKGAGRSGFRPRRASPRVLAIAASVVGVVVVGVVLAVTLSGGSGPKASTGAWPTKALPRADWAQGATQTNQLLKGIPQKGLTLGSPAAPVVLVEYIDLQCPFCDQFETEVFPNIVPKYVRTGKVKIVMRPLAFIGPDSVSGRKALVAASDQNHAFDFAAILYDNQQTENTGWLNDAMIELDAESIPGLNPRELDTQRKLASVAAAASASDQLATTDHVNSTPTIFIKSANTAYSEVPMSSPTDQATLETWINRALGK